MSSPPYASEALSLAYIMSRGPKGPLRIAQGRVIGYLACHAPAPEGKEASILL